MYKVKRTIYVKNKRIDVWFGLVSKTKNGKGGRYTVYLLTDNPDNHLNHAEPILSNIISKETAIKKGIEYVKDLFQNIIENESITKKSQKDETKGTFNDSPNNNDENLDF